MRPVPPGRLAVCTLCRMLDIYPCCVQAGTIWTRASTAFRWAGTRWGARSEVCQVSTHENKFKYIYSISSCNFLWFPLKYIISIIYTGFYSGGWWLKNSAIFAIILDIIYLLKSSDIFILDAIIISTVSWILFGCSLRMSGYTWQLSFEAAKKVNDYALW